MKEKNKLVNFIMQAVLLLSLLGIVYLFYKKQINITSYIADLTVKNLPEYAFRSLYRMFFAYVLSLAFSIPYGILAATSKRREALMLPILDILQSIPILGFFPAAIFFFISLFPGSAVGIELSAIFLIFTSQSWNIAFGVYESVSSIPKDIEEAYSFFDPEGRLKLFKLYIPSCMPKIVYNSIVSWTNGWFFLVASEIFAVGPQAFRLKGIGSFILQSATQNNLGLTFLGIAVLVVIIILLDLFVWKPLSRWSKRFTYSVTPGEEEETHVWELVTAFWDAVGTALVTLKKLAGRIRLPEFKLRIRIRNKKLFRAIMLALQRLFMVAFIAVGAYLTFSILRGLPSIIKGISLGDVVLVLKSLFASTLRIILAYAISLGWTTPFAIYMFTHPRASVFLSPLMQIVPSIPSISIFPILLYFLLPLRGGLNIASIIILLTGMQWYLLFNAYGGLKAIPSDILEFSDSFGVKGWLRFKRLLLPASLPSILTGSITALGGGWNALIVSEYIELGTRVYALTGIGSLLNVTLHNNNKPLFVLTLFVMVATVYSINHFIYRPLYDKIISRYRMEA